MKKDSVMNCIKKTVLYSLLSASLAASADHPSTGFETGAGGAVLTTPAATLSRGKAVFGIRSQFIDFNETSDARLEALGLAGEHVHSTGGLLNLSANFAYGFTDDLTFGAALPYVERNRLREVEHHHGTGEIRPIGDASGLGDMRVFGQYRFHRGYRSDAAFLAGLKIPTGETGITKPDGSGFETEHQPGSGSWDPFIGMAWNAGGKPVGWSASLLYTFVSEGTRNTDLGDVFNYNLALIHRVFSQDGNGGHDHDTHTHGSRVIDYIDATLELNGDYRRHARISDRRDDHSGGHSLYLSPGIRIGLGHRWSIYTSVGVPVINDLNGEQSEPEYRIIGGLNASF